MTKKNETQEQRNKNNNHKTHQNIEIEITSRNVTKDIE